jgi:hypothetical protein
MTQESFGATFPLSATTNRLLISFPSPTSYLQNTVAAGQFTLPVLVILISVLKIYPGLQWIILLLSEVILA